MIKLASTINWVSPFIDPSMSFYRPFKKLLFKWKRAVYLPPPPPMILHNALHQFCVMLVLSEKFCCDFDK